MPYYYSASHSGFYHHSLHDTLPGDAVALDDDQYQALMEGQSRGNSIMPPDAVHQAPWLAEPEAPSLEQALASKQAAILRSYEQALLEAQQDYPAAERQGWPAQEAEARALREDPEADCPVLAVLARLRGLGESTTELGEKVLRNAEQWRADYAYLTGNYQRMTRQVEAMAEAGASGQDILAYEVDFSLLDTAEK